MSVRIANGDALLQRSWEAMLWEESQEQDIFTALTGTYSDSDRKMPDGIVNRVMLKPGMNSHTIGMLLDLVGAGIQGAGKNLTGNLEDMVLRNFQVYANDVRHGVNIEQYGLYAHRNAAYDMAEKSNFLLGRWLKARRGKHFRQAALERVSDNLEQAPTSLTSGFNMNILIKNITAAQQPTYNSTLATYTGNILTALDNAGTAAAAQLDADFWSALEYYVTVVWKLQPLDNGTYIVTIPAKSAVYLKQISNTDGLLGLSRTAYVEELSRKTFQQVLFQIGKFVIVVDDRAPIMVYNTTNSTITPYYRDVGSTDDRSSYSQGGANRVFDVGFVLGKAAITETISMRPRYDDDFTDLNRLRDIGMSTTYGMQVTEFDADTATSSTRIAQNCGVFMGYAGTLTA